MSSRKPKDYFDRFGANPSAGRLVRDRHGRKTDQRARIAVVALLAAVSRVDHEFSHDEYQQIVSSVIEEFDVTGEEAAELADLADFMLREKHRVDDFIVQIKAYFSHAQCEEIIALCKDIAMADGRLHEREQRFVRYLQTQLLAN